MFDKFLYTPYSKYYKYLLHNIDKYYTMQQKKPKNIGNTLL